MKRFIYTILMTAIAATTLVGCEEPVDAIKTFPTKESEVDGDHDWYVEITDDDSYITAIEASPLLYYPAITVTLRLIEEVNLPENMTPEYKDIYICMHGTDRIGRMEPTDESRNALTKLLSGDVGDEAEITFVSPDKLSMMEIEEDVKDVDYFWIDYLDFTADGKIYKNELFKCIFKGADQDIVIGQFLELVDNLEKAYNAYKDEESSKGYSQLKELYNEAKIFAKKLDASLDEDDVTESQYERLEESIEIIKEVYHEI